MREALPSARHARRPGKLTKSVSSRFYRWRRSGVWQHVLEALQALADAQGRVGWEVHFLDSTVVRAHQHAAGARKTGREPWRRGRGTGPLARRLHHQDPPAL